MANSTIPNSFPTAGDQQMWQGLKKAIANSSGFQQWKEETNLIASLAEENLDDQVRLYLRSTLETLAY